MGDKTIIYTYVADQDDVLGGQIETSLHCKDDRLTSTRLPVSENDGIVMTLTRCPFDPTSSLVSKLGWFPMK